MDINKIRKQPGKNKLTTIMAGILCAVMLLSLAACGSGGGTAELNKPATENKPIYLSDMLESGGARIWYEIDNTGEFSVTNIGKDSEITRVFVFENGEVTAYIPKTSNAPGDSDEIKLRTLGDASKLTDDEIIEILKQTDLQNEQRYLDGLLTRLSDEANAVQIARDEIDMFISEYGAIWYLEAEFVYLVEEASMKSGDESLWMSLENLMNSLYMDGQYDDAEFNELLDKCFEILFGDIDAAEYDELSERIRSFESTGRSAYAYELNVITDSTGNNTKMEKVVYTYDALDSRSIRTDSSVFETISALNLEEELYTAREDAIELNFLYAEGVVYDALYGGFSGSGSSNTVMFITKIEETLISGESVKERVAPTLDNPDNPGVTVD